MPVYDNRGAVYVSYIDSSKNVYFASAYNKSQVHPSIYLKPNVKIISGIGTENDPYKLSL